MDTIKALERARQELWLGGVKVAGIDPLGRPHSRARTLRRLSDLIDGQRQIDALVAEVEAEGELCEQITAKM